MTNEQKIAAWFQNFEQRFDKRIPTIIAETATEYYKESFVTKSFAGKKWKETKKKVARGSLMVRTGALLSTIRPSLVSPTKVTINAGNSRVPYAKVHNEGGTVNKRPRSETFQRKRNAKGKFSGGTVQGRGFTFAASSFKMPQRQFMGHSAQLNKRIITRIKDILNVR